MPHYHPNPSTAYEPGSPPDEPRFMEPATADVKRHALWACRLAVQFGEEAELHCPHGWDSLVAMARDCLNELLCRVYDSDLFIGSWAAIAEDMESEIEGLLRETPAEDWPV